MQRAAFASIVVFLIMQLWGAHAAADAYRIRLDPAARSAPATGRIVVFFITETKRPYDRVDPIEGPFFAKPQPIASIAVKDFKPGDVVTLDGSSLAWPASVDRLNGKVRLQAILDADQINRSHEQGTGNVYSDVVTAEVSASRDDRVEIALTHRIDPRPARPENDHLKWVELKSEMLSKFHGRDVFHRAGVALPKGWGDPNGTRKEWPAVYWIPGFGGRDEEAAEYADMLMADGVEAIAPIAVYVCLDADAPLGHHGFCNSDNNGPRAEALVREFIPYLEERFHLIAKPEARIVTGHSSGGWSSLWLQLSHPETFGACWTRAPDPVDFSRFQMTDLYAESNMFTLPDGGETPSYRGWASSAGPTVLMTVRQENGMEHAIDPDGRSGQQWDAWEAMFSPRDDATGLPRAMFDPLTGAMHKDVVEHWRKYDMALMIANDWPKYGPIMLQRVRLAVGDEDSYYLNRAVLSLQEKIASLQKNHPVQTGDGYILIVPRADHGTVIPKTFQRWNEEMRTYLQKRGMQDADSPQPEAATKPATSKSP